MHMMSEPDERRRQPPRQIESGPQRCAGSRSQVSRTRRNGRPQVSPSVAAAAHSAAGLTAIELLVATTLASLLMVAVLHVLASLHAKWDVLRDDPAQRSVELRLASQLRWDLGHAQTLKWSPQEIRLVGYAGRSFDIGTVTHRPAEIAYTVRSGVGRRWLIRQERQTDARSRRDVDVQLVCAGILGFDLRTIDGDAPIATETQPVPDRLQVVLQRGTDVKPMRFQLVLR